MVNNCGQFIPIGSMYGIFTYIWVIFVVNVGKYFIHGSYGIVIIASIITTTGCRGLAENHIATAQRLAKTYQDPVLAVKL